MSAAGRVAAFIGGLVVVFAAAVGIGAAVKPVDTDAGPAHSGEGHGDPGGAGYTLRIPVTAFGRAEPAELRFSIEGPDGEAVRDFDELHERRLHLIVVRRDGTGFRHLHPEMDQAGTWAESVVFGEAGVYRLFADFSVAGERRTLATDLFVSGGDFEARPFPAPATSTTTDGYEVSLGGGEPRAGEASRLTFSVAREGEEVEDLAPYLGARGHLVALREGDLAFLHVHPEEAGGGHEHGGGADGGRPAEIAFTTSFPSAGRYRLYLQFRHGGSVHTAEFTVAVPR